MSYTRFIYVGPYVKIANSDSMTIKKINACSKQECKNHQKETQGTQSSLCGSITISRDKNSLLRAEDFREFCSQYLEEKLETVWTINEVNFKGFAYLVPSQSESYGKDKFLKPTMEFSAKSLNPETEVNQFKEQFSKEIETLRNLRPNHKFTIEWGSVTFAY